jgi:hypothetical protein
VLGDLHFVRIGAYFINLDNIAFTQVTSSQPEGGVYVCFNTQREDGRLFTLFLQGEDARQLFNYLERNSARP